MSSGRSGGGRSGGSGGSDDRGGRPEWLGDALSEFLQESGLAERVEQASVVPAWSELVGAEIAAVTEPLFVSADGTLFVAVRTHAWMTELQLMEPELVRALNERGPGTRVRRLRFQIPRGH